MSIACEFEWTTADLRRICEALGSRVPYMHAQEAMDDMGSASVPWSVAYRACVRAVEGVPA